MTDSHSWIYGRNSRLTYVIINHILLIYKYDVSLSKSSESLLGLKTIA